MIKKILLLIFIACALQLDVLAQPPQLIIPKWKVGDSLLVQEKGSIKMNILGMDIPMDANTRYKLKVTQKDAEGYTIEVYDMNYLGMNGGGPMEELFKELEKNLGEMMKQATAMKLIVRVSLQGEVKDLLNWKEVQLVLHQMGDALMTSMGTKYGIPQEKLDSLKLEMSSKLATKDQVMNETLDQVEYLMSGYNIKYPLTGKLNVSAMLFSRMNYFELNHKGVAATLSTKTVSRKPTETQVAYDVIYNRQALLDYINSQSADKYTKEMLDKMVFTEDRSFNFNSTNNWPKYIKMNAHIAMEEMMNITIATEYAITQY
ncbi:MAG: hypothetical protein ACTHJT_10375 [Cytophaga sp.]|uniref:hypothetical protein n=1 Tax=Cytophaga sp. TaxID=29535 RepID=UPI003F7EDF32